MPYETVADLPPAFSSLPQGARSLAMRTMNAVLEGKTETKALIIEAIRAAWGNIKSAYSRMANGTWVAKSEGEAIPSSISSTMRRNTPSFIIPPTLRVLNARFQMENEAGPILLFSSHEPHASQICSFATQHSTIQVFHVPETSS